MSKPPRIIDAEYEIVSEPPKPLSQQSWNGIGLPPEWPTWPLLAKIAYLIIYVSGVLGLTLLGRWGYGKLMGYY